ncbi:MAG: diaminopimelate decarboxylase [bacterium]
MTSFNYKNNRLYAEQVSVEKIAREVGTPAYLYSYETLKNQFHHFRDAFGSASPLICFSMKCNSNLAILKAIANWGGGVDIVSGGELFRALKAGVNPKKIVYSGVGKTDAEIAQALKAGILVFNVESEEELQAIQRVAKKLKKKAPVSLRVNPNIDPKTHPYISTGMKKSKFGIDVKKALEIYQKASKLSHIEIVGVDCHIGSQLTQVRPFVDALKKLKELIQKIRAAGIPLQYLDLGGGLGIRYKNELPPSPKEYAKALLNELKGMNLKLIFEPGRWLMGNAGILVTRTLYTKKTAAKEFVIVDGAMNDLIRPAFYGSYHDIQPVVRGKGAKRKSDVVGPICESGDFFAQDRLLPPFKSGDLLALFSAGAYGFAMASNYNTRPRAAEVLVKGGKYHVIRKRESHEDLIRGEAIPTFLKG